MTPTEDPQKHDPVDEALRSVLLVPHASLEKGMRESRHETLGRLRGVRVEPAAAPRRRTWGRRMAVASSFAAIGLVVVAIAPSFMVSDDGSGAVSVPALTPDASAAESLRWAGRALVAEGAPDVGTGSVWHSVSVTTTAGRVTGVRERWLDTKSEAWKEISVSRSPSRPSYDAWYTTFDGDVMRFRGFRRDDADGEWRNPSFYLQADVPGGRQVSAEMFGGPPPRVIGREVNGRTRPINDPAPDPDSIPPFRVSATVDREEATRRWIEAASRTDNAKDLERATYIFLRTTRGHFAGIARDANPNARRSTTVRQLIHLLTVARSRPAATRVLYERFAKLDQLRRLDDVVVDGRRAMRIQYETGDLSGTREVELGGKEMEQLLLRGEVVLLIDLETGAPLRTETVDRAKWTDLRPAQRVHAVGDGQVACHDVLAAILPCDLIDGTSAVALQADKDAQSGRALAFADQFGGSAVKPSAGYATMRPDELDDMRLDADGLPLDDPDKPIGEAKSQWGQIIPVYPLAELPSD